MGPIVDRTKERLVSSDTGIIKARQKLRKAVEALRDEGATPPGVDPAHQRVRSAAIVLPQAESFIEFEPRGRGGPARRGARVGVTAPDPRRRAAPAPRLRDEARFRIDRPIGGRSARIIALDRRRPEIVLRVAELPWGASRFFADASALRPAAELEDADVAIMIGTADADARRRREDRAGVRGARDHDGRHDPRRAARGGRRDSALRPYARNLMVTEDEDDVAAVLTALRA